MTLVFILYCITTLLPGLSSVFLAVAIILGVVLLIIWVFRGILWIEGIESEGLEKARKNKHLYVWFVVSIVGTNLIPDKETSYLLLAAYGVETIVTNERVQELGGKSLEVLEKAMGEYLDEGKEDSTDTKESK